MLYTEELNPFLDIKVFYYVDGWRYCIECSEAVIVLPKNMENKKTFEILELVKTSAKKYAKVEPVNAEHGFFYDTNIEKQAGRYMPQPVKVF